MSSDEVTLKRILRLQEQLDGLQEQVGQLRGQVMSPSPILAALESDHRENLVRFDQIEAVLKSHDARFDRIERILESHDTRLDRLSGRLDAMSERLDAVDGRLAVLPKIDSQLAAILAKLS
jgi:chromosome segregation ATPase